MTSVHEAPTAQAAETDDVASLEHLAEVRATGAAMRVRRRRLDPAIIAFVSAQQVLMPRQRLFTLWHGEPLEPAVDARLDQFLDRRWFGYAAWRADLLGLVALARRLASGPSLRVRIETVASNSCRLFHSDHVALRMITTYRGPGTEWLPACAVDPRAPSRQDNQHVRDMSRLQRLAPGDVALMKGDRYPGTGAPGLMHRSPLAGPEQPRIVLAIDLD